MHYNEIKQKRQVADRLTVRKAYWRCTSFLERKVLAGAYVQPGLGLFKIFSLMYCLGVREIKLC